MAIDREETKNLLFGGLKKYQTPEVEKIESPNRGAANIGSSQLPKWKTLEKVTVLLTSEQKDSVDELARKIMRFRQRLRDARDDRERITANSVVRAILDNAIERLEILPMEAIHTEDELKSWVSSLFR